MDFFDFLRGSIPDTHPIRLLYHKIKAFCAALIYFFPADKLKVVGVTGTNGKTTTVNLITTILMEAGHKVGMTSSINFQIGEKRWANTTKQSTIDPFKLQKMLRQMVKSGCEFAILEVTSHALTQSRVLGVNFDVAVITNVTPEHVEYHGSFDNYVNAKGALFKKVSRGRRKFNVPKVLVLNSDDPYFSYFDQYVADVKINYGLKNATIRAGDVVKKPQGSHFTLHVPNNALPIDLALPGEFNVYNALAASAVAISLQVPFEKIKAGLEKMEAVPGRFEHVKVGQEYSVIVDYAHTPESLENLLMMYKKLTTGRLFAVFGATGGGRDKAKRPKMGAVADDYADYIILTDDDPYSENEISIIDDIAEGLSRKEGDNFWKIPDRKEAIRLALTLAKAGDTVVVAGKGCEEVMMLKGKRISWSDKRVIQDLLKREIEVDLGDNNSIYRENIRLKEYKPV